MSRSGYKIFLFVQMFSVSHKVIIESEILAVSLPRGITDFTLLPNQSSFAVHAVHNVTSKEMLATVCYYY